MVKTFKNVAAQGDVMFIRVDVLPEGLIPVKAENGYIIVTHSETSHHHVIADRPGVEMFQDAMDLFRSWLVIKDIPAEIEHLRSFDTHETIRFEPGIYEVRRQQEYSPEGWRRAAD